MRERLLHALPAALLLALTLAAALPARAQSGDDLRRTPVVRAVESVAPAVVNITSTQTVEAVPTPFGGALQGPLFERFMRQFGIQPVPEQAQSLGSGVIIDGHRRFVLTNAHVITGAEAITVRLLDGREFKAALVGSDPDFDLAVLKIEQGGDLPQATLGDSGHLLMGETVIAIGNPYGFTNTVTTGVVSAQGRSVSTEDGEVLTDLIQTDAAINPGNSGGPLLNILGQVIGINSAIHAQAEGIGFAIPINKAKRVINELIASGHVTPVWLGVFGQDVDQPTAGYLGLRQPVGLLVTDVEPNGPADRAGLRRGDVILALDGHQVDDRGVFLSLVRGYGQGDSLTMTVSRKGRTLDLAAKAQALGAGELRSLVLKHWGLAAKGPGHGGGLVLGQVAPNTPAARVGLRPGDIIHQIGNQPVNADDDLGRAFLRNHLQNTLLLRVQRGNGLYYVRMAV